MGQKAAVGWNFAARCTYGHTPLGDVSERVLSWAADGEEDTCCYITGWGVSKSTTWLFQPIHSSAAAVFTAMVQTAISAQHFILKHCSSYKSCHGTGQSCFVCCRWHLSCIRWGSFTLSNVSGLFFSPQLYLRACALDYWDNLVKVIAQSCCMYALACSHRSHVQHRQTTRMFCNQMHRREAACLRLKWWFWLFSVTVQRFDLES